MKQEERSEGDGVTGGQVRAVIIAGQGLAALRHVTNRGLFHSRKSRHLYPT